MLGISRVIEFVSVRWCRKSIEWHLIETKLRNAWRDFGAFVREQTLCLRYTDLGFFGEGAFFC
jgi:hypothetical protein